MKKLAVILAIACCARGAEAQYQESVKNWRVAPELLIVRYLPGENLGPGSSSSDAEGGYQYSGFGGSLLVRFMNVNLPGIAFTISGGATSYYRPDYSGIAVPFSAIPESGNAFASTLGGDPRMRDFFVFPASVGVQAIWPWGEMDKFRLFAAAEASAYFVDGSIAPGAQTRFGYTLGGGFGVGIVELGARYSQFADMKNIGVLAGFCIKPYEF